MNRTVGIILVVLGLIGIALTFFYFNGLGGTGHLKADSSFVVGVILLLIGLFGMMRKQS
jgi:hypothetical protein